MSCCIAHLKCLAARAGGKNLNCTRPTCCTRLEGGSSRVVLWAPVKGLGFRGVRFRV